MIVYYLFNYKLNYWLCTIHIWLQIFQSMDFCIYLTITRSRIIRSKSMIFDYWYLLPNCFSKGFSNLHAHQHLKQDLSIHICFIISLPILDNIEKHGFLFGFCVLFLFCFFFLVANLVDEKWNSMNCEVGPYDVILAPIFRVKTKIIAMT